MAQYRNQPNFSEETEPEAPAQESAVDQVALVKSYLAFLSRAVKKRLTGAILTFVAVVALSAVVLSLWPKTYRSESTMVFNRGGALDAGVNDTPFRGATDEVRRRESLVKIVRETELVARFHAERAPLGKAKAWLSKALGSAEARPEDVESALVLTLNAALWTTVDDTSMTIGVNWSSADSAARIVTAAQKTVLHERHVAEIATIQEKMAILDGHSVEVRKEIDQIADQLKGARDETIAEIGKAAKAATLAASATATSAPPPRRTVAASAPATPSAPAVSEEEVARQKEALEDLKKELELKTRMLEDLKAQRRQSLATAQAQMAELLTKYTPAHPDVRRVERTIELLSQPSPQVAGLERDVKSLTERIRQEGRPAPKAEARQTRTGIGGPGPAPKSAGDALPADILKLLEPGRDSSTPNPVTAQLHGAVSKYAALRESIRQARVDLDTAQAAFAHRYKIVAPAEAPGKPVKPVPLQVIGIGILAALVLAVAWPLVAELRTGVIVERWQVYQLGLPLLSEMRLPPGHGD